MTPQQLAAATGIDLHLAAVWAPPLGLAIERWGVQRIPQFLAQITHESQGFTRLEENLNYRSAKRLLEVWPKRFAGLEDAQRFVGKPELLANHVYARRLGNGDAASGDGWRYRGRGLKQVTGYGNYWRYQEASGVPAVTEPDQLLQASVAADSAAWFWADHQLDALTDVRLITRVVNGPACLGLDERLALTERAMKVFA